MRFRRNVTGKPIIYGTFYSVRNGETKNAKILPVDAAKYRESVDAAAKKFLDFHMDEFLNGIKG